MTDTEPMSAVRMDFEYRDEFPVWPKPKKSLLQKALLRRMTERTGAIKPQRHSIGGRSTDQDASSQEPRATGRSTSSMDLLKALPGARNSRSKQAQKDFALRYDDLEDGMQPFPLGPESPRLMRRENNEDAEFSQHTHKPDFALRYDESEYDRQSLSTVSESLPLVRPWSSGDLTGSQHQHDHTRADYVIPSDPPSTPRFNRFHNLASVSAPHLSICVSPTFSPCTSRVLRRARSIPNQMSDEQIDKWLEKPEDAELHQKRKLSAASATSNEASARSPRVFNSVSIGLNPGSEQGSKQRREAWIYTDTLTSLAQQPNTVTAPDPPTLLTLPHEVLVKIARHLDAESRGNCRQVCRKLGNTIPPPTEWSESRKKGQC